ncbi:MULTISPECIES: hypothetical protein [Streptomyces]|uniref:hypothetical protein n=1 Tax=Streptomyces TaxID=1883 RepID=UPI0036917052
MTNTSITSISRMPNPAEFVPELNDISAALALVEATLQPAPHGRKALATLTIAIGQIGFFIRPGRHRQAAAGHLAGRRAVGLRAPAGRRRPPQAPLGPVGPGLGGRVPGGRKYDVHGLFAQRKQGRMDAPRSVP